jgi:hypothetical protein
MAEMDTVKCPDGYHGIFYRPEIFYAVVYFQFKYSLV